MSMTFRAYFIWLLLGVSGAHHFYLGRPRQGFLWLTTLAFGGLGWLRDAWCLPRYIREAGGGADPDNASSGKRNDPRPTALRRRLAMRKASWARLAAMVLVGHLYGYLLLVYLLGTGFFQYDPVLRRPEHQVCLLAVPAVGIAVGVHLVGSVGQLQASFVWSLLGSALGLALPWVDNTRSVGYLATSSLLATTLTYLKGLTLKSVKKIRPEGLSQRARRCVFQLALLVACCFVYFSLLFAAVDYHSMPFSNVEEEDGLLVKKVLVALGPLVKDILKQFLFLADQFMTTAYYGVVDFCIRLETLADVFKDFIAEQFTAISFFVNQLITTVYNTAADICLRLEHCIDMFGQFFSTLYDAVADFYPGLDQFLSWFGDLMTVMFAECRKGFKWLIMTIWLEQQQSETDEVGNGYGEEFVEPFDLNELDPYKILGVSTVSPTLQDIKHAYNKMVKKWHPDKIQGSYRKEKAHVIFMKIQKAYEQLKKRHKKW